MYSHIHRGREKYSTDTLKKRKKIVQHHTILDLYSTKSQHKLSQVAFHKEQVLDHTLVSRASTWQQWRRKTFFKQAENSNKTRLYGGQPSAQTGWVEG